ncbi:NAD-dependent deacylase [Kocuria sp. cx-116]|uniref:SIR2 family NAD-dependent protein deacylase n=1 Tax=Kocuria sp. cx-116 TaxID=2771378 RepID=UPI001687BFA6|nr:NAD-dependent deacylase [Kocuria sp. cx-116]MBD2762887.1 NAD-dependent deacylase [Kocuria sp. cx-116]
MSASDRVPTEILDLARSARRVTVLTGAGMSAESGVPTFRDAQTGLWERFDPAELATPEAWEDDPAQCWAWYTWRASLVRRADPHPGHVALAQWQARPGIDLWISTQNVDDLHERAGAGVLAHVHGNLFALHCASCGAPADVDYPPITEPVARLDPPGCHQCGGPVRPGVVWFGETLPERAFQDSVEAVQEADLVLVVGTSGLVHPAASIPDFAGARGVPVVEINPRVSKVSGSVDHVWRAPAGQALPALVSALD